MPANPNDERVRIYLNGYELLTPFTKKELEEHNKRSLTKEETEILNELEKNFYSNPKNFTKSQLDEIIENADPKFLKAIIFDFAERAEKIDLKGPNRPFPIVEPSTARKYSKLLKSNEEFQDEYKHFISKLVNKYQTFKKDEQLAEKEKEKLENEKNKTRNNISSILEDENLGKKFFKEASSEDLEVFEKHYKPLVKQIFNTEELSNNALNKIKRIKDKALIEKKTAENIAKKEAEQKTLKGIPEKTEKTLEQSIGKRSSSRGRPLYLTEETLQNISPPVAQVSIPSAKSSTEKKEPSSVKEEVTGFATFLNDLLRKKKEATFSQNASEQTVAQAVKPPVAQAVQPIKQTQKEQTEKQIDPEVYEAYTEELPRASKTKIKVPERELFPTIPDKESTKEGIDIPTAMESQALENIRQLANLRISNPPELQQYNELPQASKEALAEMQDYAIRGNDETKELERKQKQNLELIKKQENIDKAIRILENSDDPESRELAKQLIKENKYIEKAETFLTKQPNYQKDVEELINAGELPELSLQALSGGNYDPLVRDAIADVNYEEPDLSFDLSEQEQKLLNDKLAAFERQAQQNFEQNELRRHKTMYGHKGVSGASGADNIRSKLFGDYYKFVTDKKSDIAEQFHQQSFLRKKELADIRARKAQIALNKAETWIKANELRNREKHALSDSLGKIQKLQLDRAQSLANYQKLLIEASQGNVQAMALLGMNRNQSAAELNRIVSTQKDLALQQARGFSGVESARQGGAINYQNAISALRESQENERAKRIAAGLTAGEMIRNEKQEAQRIRLENARQMRDLPLLENQNVLNAALASKGNIPMPSISQPTWLQTPENVPNLPKPNENTLKNAVGLGLTAASVLGQNNATQVTNQMPQNELKNLAAAESQKTYSRPRAIADMLYGRDY